MGDTPIAVITDSNIENKNFDIVMKCDDPKYGWSDKPNLIKRTPFDKTLYFDTDVYITEEVTEIFDLVDEYNIALAHEPARVTAKIESVPDCFPEFNTGVFGFNNNSETQRLLREWNEIYQSRDETEDQPSLRKAVFESDISFSVLPPEYNCRWQLGGHVSGRVKVFHGRLYEFKDNICGIESDIGISEAIKKINYASCSRVFINQENDLKHHEYY